MDDEVVVYGQPFAVVPEGVLYADISDRAVRLFCVLQRHVNAQAAGEQVRPSRYRLAALLACSVDSIDRAMKELVQLKAVHKARRERGNGSQTSNTYHLQYDLLPGSRKAAAPTAAAQLRPHPAAPVRPPEREPSSNESNAVSSTQHGAATAGSSKPKRVDLLWDVFDDLLGGVTNDTERGKRNRALKAIRQSLQADGVADAQLQAAALRARVLRAQQAWGTRGITVTELAVAGNWRVLGANNDAVTTLTAQEIYDMTREVA